MRARGLFVVYGSARIHVSNSKALPVSGIPCLQNDLFTAYTFCPLMISTSSAALKANCPIHSPIHPLINKVPEAISRVPSLRLGTVSVAKNKDLNYGCRVVGHATPNNLTPIEVQIGHSTHMTPTQSGKKKEHDMRAALGVMHPHTRERRSTVHVQL